MVSENITELNSKLELPENLEPIRAIIEEYLEYKIVIKKPYKTKIGINNLIKRLSRWGHERAGKALEYSMANEWEGVFEEPESPSSRNNRTDNHCETEFNLLMALIGRYGRNNFITAVPYIKNKTTLYVVRTIGWNKLCNMQVDLARKVFIDIYKNNKE